MNTTRRKECYLPSVLFFFVAFVWRCVLMHTPLTSVSKSNGSVVLDGLDFQRSSSPWLGTRLYNHFSVELVTQICFRNRI